MRTEKKGSAGSWFKAMDNKQLEELSRLLDHELGLGESETDKPPVSDDEPVRAAHRALRHYLRTLGTWDDDEPPTALAQRTVAFVRQHGEPVAPFGRSLRVREYAQTVTPAQTRTRWLLGNLRDAIAVAACVLFVFMLSRPALKRAQQIAQKQYCASQLLKVGEALAAYGEDYHRQLPFAGRSEGSKWWYVGGQDDDHVSNTRHFFLLTKGGYVPTRVFLCPNARPSKPPTRVIMDASTLEAMNDFPSRDHVNYSFRLMVQGNNPVWRRQAETLVATDQNPLFANFDVLRNETLDLADHAELEEANSPNHGGRGQNVLFLDGRVAFTHQRRVGLGADDMFTIRKMRRYRGVEVPAAADDTFIAP